ncbi:MAG: histidinol-phosphatase, partial [Gammaproteobacteria bacterium]|nr:histidinol-phosphatase [Gammaproteobacteria bacterium]
IDGTRAFISGLLHWGVLLALCDEGQPILGLMYQPFTDELFVGEPDGSWYSRHNKKTTLNTRNETDLPSATLMTTDPRLFREKSQSRSYQRLENSVRLTRYGGDCYQYAVLSAGSIDLVCENQLNPWDILALIPIVLNAGGSITDWRGGDPTKGGHILASGSCELHEAALEVLDYHD